MCSSDLDQVTVFDSVGFALEDYSALRYLHALAQRHDVGIDVALIPTASDPKDLFGGLMQMAATPAAFAPALADALAFTR